MKDVSIINPGKKIIHPGSDQWSEENNQTVLRFKTGTEGTAVIGVSTLSKVIEFSAADFAEYLKHDGILDVFEARKESGEEKNPATEKYSKHVKALVQVGSKLTQDYKKSLGYPVEFIPLENPFSLKSGDEFYVQLLKGGRPLTGELVYASYNDFHGHAKDGSHIEAVKTRTDTHGIARIKLSVAGHWYVRAINMVKSSEKGMITNQIGQRLHSK